LTLKGALHALGFEADTLEAAGLRASSNLDVVRSIRAAWERGDFSSADWAHPDIEFVFEGGPAPGSWTGLAGMAKTMRDFLSTWEEFRSEAEEYRKLDDEQVLVFARFGGRGKTSGVELGQVLTKGAELFQVREGRVTRLVIYWDRERAFADLGLPSEANSPRS
jgi:ketosteroid isomerase-like protein